MQHRHIVLTMTLLPATWVTASPRLLQIQETPALSLVLGPVPLYNIPPNPKPSTALRLADICTPSTMRRASTLCLRAATDSTTLLGRRL